MRARCSFLRMRSKTQRVLGAAVCGSRGALVALASLSQFGNAERHRTASDVRVDTDLGFANYGTVPPDGSPK
jgi:hypothetical protein